MNQQTALAFSPSLFCVRLVMRSPHWALIGCRDDGRFQTGSCLILNLQALCRERAQRGTTECKSEKGVHEDYLWVRIWGGFWDLFTQASITDIQIWLNPGPSHLLARRGFFLLQNTKDDSWWLRHLSIYICISLKEKQNTGKENARVIYQFWMAWGWNHLFKYSNPKVAPAPVYSFWKCCLMI